MDEGDEAQAIKRILRLMQQNGVTIEQLAKARESYVPGTEADQRSDRGAGVIAMRIFPLLGAVFVLGGIGAYIAMFWPTMSSAMRIFVTLGIGIGLSVFSIVAMKEAKYPRIILPLIVLAALIEAGGWFVFVDELFPHSGDARHAACFVFGMMALQQWVTFSFFRRTALFFFAVMFSYGFLENALDILGMHEECIELLLGGSLMCVSDWTAKSKHQMLAGLGYFCAGCWFNEGLYDYVGQAINWHAAAMATGLSLCSLGYGLERAMLHRLSALGFLTGSALFYGGLFEWVEHKPYELLYLCAAIAMMVCHARLKSRMLLVTSTLAVFGFIAYYTEEHFVQSIGWPVALILLGALFFGIGAFAVRLRKTI
jgi:hypothetical protein